MNERLRAHSNLNFDEFTTLIHQLINVAWGDKWGKFVASFPSGTDSTHVDLPIITYQLDEMVPGKIGSGDNREIRPRLRDTVPADEDGEGGADVYGQLFDCTVKFECWAEGNAKATQLAMDFIEFMNTFKGYFMSEGVNSIVFRKMNNPAGEYQLRDDAASRVLEYSVRLEHVTSVNYDVIKRITGTVSQMREDDGTKEFFPFVIEED